MQEASRSDASVGLTLETWRDDIGDAVGVTEIRGKVEYVTAGRAAEPGLTFADKTTDGTEWPRARSGNWGGEKDFGRSDKPGPAGDSMTRAPPGKDPCPAWARLIAGHSG